MKKLLVLSLLVLSFGSLMAEESAGDCSDIAQSKEEKSSDTSTKKPVTVEDASAIDG